MVRHHQHAVNPKAYDRMAGTDIGANVGIHEKTEINALLNAVVTSDSLTFDKYDHVVRVHVVNEEKADQLDSKKSQLKALGIDVIDNGDSISLSMSTQKFLNLKLDWKNIKLPVDLAEIQMLAKFARFVQNRGEVQTLEPGKRALPGNQGLYITMPEINWNEATGIKFQGDIPKNPQQYMAKIVGITNKLGEFDFELQSSEHPKSFAITSEDTPTNSFLEAVKTVLRKSGVEIEERNHWF